VGKTTLLRILARLQPCIEGEAFLNDKNWLTIPGTEWRASVREAVRAGMTPTINSLMVVGLVSLPGMMTGQILGGTDPREAVRYQIVVMLMITAAVAIGCLILVGLSYKKLFNQDGALKPFVMKSKN